ADGEARRPTDPPRHHPRRQEDIVSTLITNIGELVTCDGTGEGGVGARTGHALVVVGDRIAWVGPAAAAPSADEVVDVGGRCVIPGFVDSHAHLVFDGDRSAEFAARMAGERYDGGGIGVTVEATRAAGDERLRAAL